MSPYLFDSRWYDMVAPSAKGEYIAYYENVYGRKYGLQRINTGYEFNSDAKDLMKDILFRGAAEVMENSKFFVDLGTNIPAVFQDAGGTYVLSKNGEKEEFALPSVPSSVTRRWWNDNNNTYDIFSKLQFHEAENKQYDERDTMVFLRGMRSLEGITDRLCVTDDTAIMMSLNGSTPCWLLEHQFTDPAHKVTHLPMFSRYIWSNYGIGIIAESLDFGTPEEVQIPDVTFNVKSSIFSQYWEKYIKDRYDDDSKVMTCKVNLSGMQINESLFRKFYYWDGAIWALNKIINHSLTTWDDTECEFIKVQDINNYIG
jgi:hypothetical protein